MNNLETKLKRLIAKWHKAAELCDCNAKNAVSESDRSLWVTKKHEHAHSAGELEALLPVETQPSVQAEGQAGGSLAVEQIRDAHRATMSESLDFQDSYFYRKLADRLNALLLHAKPGESVRLERELAESRSEFAVLSRACGNWREWPIGTISKDVPDYTHDDWKAAARAILERNELREREARIRKDVLEEAARECERWAREMSTYEEDIQRAFKEGCTDCASRIRALAERPAPAGEATGASK